MIDLLLTFQARPSIDAKHQGSNPFHFGGAQSAEERRFSMLFGRTRGSCPRRAKKFQAVVQQPPERLVGQCMFVKSTGSNIDF